MNDYFYKKLQIVFSIFWRCRVINKENIPSPGPAVLVSNHLGSYGPIAVLSGMPVRLYPWVEHQTADWKLSPDYLRRDFVEPELHFKPPLSHLAAWLIAWACVLLMKIIQVIPVYEKSMKLTITWKRSLELLKQKKLLVVFPENSSVPLNEVMNEFDQGFIGLAPLYHQKTGKVLKFFPVAVHKGAKAIKIGQPVAYNPQKSIASERERIKKALQASITKMYLSLSS
jgi:1-acyl-sn-glycerol-3-phosphate acyltransferase